MRRTGFIIKKEHPATALTSLTVISQAFYCPKRYRRTGELEGGARKGEWSVEIKSLRAQRSRHQLGEAGTRKLSAIRARKGENFGRK